MGQNIIIRSFFCPKGKKSHGQRPKPSAGAKSRPMQRAVSSSSVKRRNVLKFIYKVSRIETEMSSDSRQSLNHRDPPPPVFESQYQSQYQDCELQSLDTSLDIKTHKFQSKFQSQYQDSNFKSLDLSLNIKNKLSTVLIPVTMSRLNSCISNLCPNPETGSEKQEFLENATPSMCKIFLFGKMVVTFDLMLQFDAQ